MNNLKYILQSTSIYQLKLVLIIEYKWQLQQLLGKLHAKLKQI